MAQYDYIVIGAGSAGSAVAGRLSESPGDSVLVLEAGGSDKRLPVLMPAATYLKAIANPVYDWRYKAAPDPTRHGRRDFMPRGKVLGGTSSINGMAYVRGQPEDFDDWAEAGCTGWSYKDVLPYYMKSEDNENGASAFHGAGGRLGVSNIRQRHELSDAFLAAAGHVGLRVTDDINLPPQDGIGYIQVTQRNGWRCNAARAFLWQARRRPNLRIATHAHVRRILFEGRRAVGVEYVRRGKTLRVMAGRAVILSAGALSSPQILMLSGVGPAAHLRDRGVEVVLDVPGVGRNFHDHPGASISVHVNRPTYNMMNTLGHHLLFGAQWLFTGTGPGTTPDAHVIGFTRSKPGANRCDIQYHFTPAGYDLAEDGPILFEQPVVTGYTNVHRPWSRGWIGLKSPDPFDQPEIQPNLFGDGRDLQALIDGSRILRRIFQAPPMAGFVENEMAPGRNVQSDDEWADYIRRSAMGIYHPAGTCKMGVDPMAVVDQRLAVRGAEHLYVADASIMPVIVSANLNASCIMIGEKCADMLRSS
jgi:choline dehydrogenase